jgi:hypothetical protein
MSAYNSAGCGELSEATRCQLLGIIGGLNLGVYKNVELIIKERSDCRGTMDEDYG